MSLPIDEQITFIYCEDIDKTAFFYEKVLGLELALNQGSCRIYNIVGHKAYLGICEGGSRREKDGVIFTLVSQDVDAWYERLIAEGIVCEHPPRENPTYQIYHFFVRDPNGYLVEVQRFLDKNWDRSK